MAKTNALIFRGDTMSRNVYKITNHHSPNIELIKEKLSIWIGEDEFTSHYFLRGLYLQNSVGTIEAFDHNEMVGLLTSWQSDFHPFCTYFSIVSKPHSGFKIEAELLEFFCKSKKIQYPLQTSVWESSYRLKAFFEECGFIEIRRTYSPFLKPSNIDYKQVLPEFSTQDLDIKDLQSLADNQEIKLELIQLVKENYEKSHKANPVGGHILEKWEQLIFAEDTILQGSFILMKDHEIQAYALLHESDNPNQWEFGWRGTKANADIRFMLLLTAFQINFAVENGVISIEAEIDTTDVASLEMLKFFPFSPAPTLITYQKLEE